MKFSLLTVTMGRESELERLRASLEAQTYRNFEWIVIDQRQEKATGGGLSAARNLALSMATGDVVVFPDDDAWFAPEVLQSAMDLLTPQDIDGVSFRVTDEDGVPSAGWMAGSKMQIRKSNVWHTAVSCSLFIKRSVIGNLRFDERLGVGSGTRFGSGEETDFVLKLLQRNVRLFYDGTVHVFHPQYKGRYEISRGWRYGNGCGCVLRRHRYGIGRLLWMVLSQLARAGQSLVQLRMRKAAFHVVQAFGRIAGYFVPLTDRRG